MFNKTNQQTRGIGRGKESEGCWDAGVYGVKIPQVKVGRRPGDAENQIALTEKALLELN
ncbi:hypothetical protein DY000_02007449 [Brassica cretica]|uniref:G-patch domain-containing protein n=1 Tax=Brassica cretica TaxID=69181 RepID=A0ABQ7CK50_BRACR|nr:hypothetical protein DY000_02007449 [Brassica cretica]